MVPVLGWSHWPGTYSCDMPQSKQLGHEVPLLPWIRLVIDIFHFENSSFLLVVVYYSRFPIVKLHRMTAKHVTSHLKTMSSEYGWSDSLVSDNGPCYVAIQFRQALNDMAVHPITSLPNYLQTNSLAEKCAYLSKACYVRPKSQVKTHTLP